jgi:hypothetical protein
MQGKGGRPRKEPACGGRRRRKRRAGGRAAADGVARGGRACGGRRGHWRRAGGQRPMGSLEEDGRAAPGGIAGGGWWCDDLEQSRTRGRRGRGPGVASMGYLACMRCLLARSNRLIGWAEMGYAPGQIFVHRLQNFPRPRPRPVLPGAQLRLCTGIYIYMF